MKRSRWLLFVLIVALAGSGVGLFLWGAAANSAGTVVGTVLDDEGSPIAGAHVRVRATSNFTLTDPLGGFTLTGVTVGQQIEVAAWYAGFYITSTHVTPTVSGVNIRLRPYHTTDNPGYQWVDPTDLASSGACGNCHPMILPQWQNNAHGGAVSNPRFFSLYNGTDVTGTASTGPGYLLDFPGTNGTCANCHAPGAGVDGYLTTNMNAARDQITEGIHCDFCHKVGGAYLNPATDSVYHNAPGAQSLRVLRPPQGDNIFFGPYDDIKDPDTFLPLITQSQYCAACHQFSFWGTPIYESYEEWQASPYAAQGVTCQDCHMPPNGDIYFADPNKGGLPHPPETIPSHQQLGAQSLELLQDTVTMTLSARVENGIVVTVTITNTGAGHHVPTDFPGRHLILVVNATDDVGGALAQVTGPTVPGWGGAESGSSGTAFAKVLVDIASGASPVVSYWKQALIARDNRIPALGSDTSVYTFSTPPGGGNVQIRARIIFRRVFQSLADQKGWTVPDIQMEDETLVISVP
jgi:hypothetical protein